MKEILPRIRYYMQHRCGGALQTEAVIFPTSTAIWERRRARESYWRNSA